MKRIVLLIALVSLLFAACGDDDEAQYRDDNHGPLRVTDVGVHGSLEAVIVDFDGQDVRCLVYNDAYRGGLSCDWNGR